MGYPLEIEKEENDCFKYPFLPGESYREIYSLPGGALVLLAPDGHGPIGMGKDAVRKAEPDL